MKFCDCNSGKYKWRDIAKINGEFYKVDEDVHLCEGESIDDTDSTFDIIPIFDKLAAKYNVDVDDIELATFEPKSFSMDVVNKMLNYEELGGYCAVCGGDV